LRASTRSSLLPCGFDDLTSRCRLRLVGTRSRAIRRRTSKEGPIVKTGGVNWKSLSSDSARERPQKQQKKRRDMPRRTRGSASLPAPAERLGPIISTMHTNSSRKQRPSCQSFLGQEYFLGRAMPDRAGARPYQHVMPDRAGVHLYHVERAEWILSRLLVADRQVQQFIRRK